MQDNGISLRTFASSTGGRILLIVYALYGQDESAYLIPGNVVITDDTGGLRSQGQVTHLDRFHDVNIGAITFEGPLYESSLLTLAMGQVRKIGPTLEELGTISGDWRLDGFMSNILRGTKPPKGERNFVVFRSDDFPVGLGDVELIGIETVIKTGTTDYYVRWQLRHVSGETRDVFYSRSGDGRVRLATLTEYMEARFGQRAATED